MNIKKGYCVLLFYCKCQTVKLPINSLIYFSSFKRRKNHCFFSTQNRGKINKFRGNFHVMIYLNDMLFYTITYIVSN